MKKVFLTVLFGIILPVFAGMSLSLSGQTKETEKKSTTAAQEQKKPVATKTVYTCSMHPEVVQDKPGKCPKCGMTLIAKEIKNTIYVCPMHPDVVQDKPGKCPKCGMNLVLKEPDKK